MIDAVANADLWAYADLAYQGADPANHRAVSPPATATIAQPVHRQPQLRPQPGPRRTGGSHAEDLENPDQAALLPQRATAIIAAIRVLQTTEDQPE